MEKEIDEALEAITSCLSPLEKELLEKALSLPCDPSYDLLGDFSLFAAKAFSSFPISGKAACDPVRNSESSRQCKCQEFPPAGNSSVSSIHTSCQCKQASSSFKPSSSSRNSLSPSGCSCNCHEHTSCHDPLSEARNRSFFCSNVNPYHTEEKLLPMDLEEMTRLLLPWKNSYHLVFVNGEFYPAFSFLKEEALNISIASASLEEIFSKENKNEFFSEIQDPRFFYQNLLSPYRYKVNLQQSIHHPLHIIHIATVNSSSASCSTSPTCPSSLTTLLFSFGNSVHASLCFHDLVLHDKHPSLLTSKNTFFSLEKNAKVKANIFAKTYKNPVTDFFVSLQESDSHLTIHQGVSSSYKYGSYFFLSGESASVKTNSLSLLSYGQKFALENKVFHKAKKSFSHQLWRSILKGDAKYEGLAVAKIASDCQKSDCEQLFQNILLSDNAKFCTQPQFWISTDDVKAKHGATSGPIHPELLFYLESRGLTEKQSLEMYLKGFCSAMVPTCCAHSAERFSSFIDSFLTGEM